MNAEQKRRKVIREVNERSRIALTVTHVRRRYEEDFGDDLWLFDTRVKWHVYDRNNHRSWLAPVDDKRFHFRWQARLHARKLNKKNRELHYEYTVVARLHAAILKSIEPFIGQPWRWAA